MFTKEEARLRKNERQREYSKRTGYESQRRYNAERGKTISFRLFKPQHNKIIDWIDGQSNKAEYFKNLVIDDMKKHGIDVE